MRASVLSMFGWGLAAGLLCALLSTQVLSYTRSRGLLDRPGPRRSHSGQTPRGGGLAIVVSILVLAWLSGARDPAAFGTLSLLSAGTISLAVLGFWDDHRPLPAGTRLGIQFLVAITLIYAYGGVGGVTLGPIEMAGWYVSPVAVVVIVWFINLFNFMDGINGIAGLQAAFVGSVFAAVSLFQGDALGALLGALVVGSCAGFLPWNFPRARIFMGDVGSYGLGFVLAFLLLRGHLQGSFSVALSLTCFGVFAVDATLTLLWRLRRRARWYTAHRDHAYQRLVRRGWSHTQVVGAVMLLNLLLVLPALWWAQGVAEREWRACVATLILIAGLWVWVRRMRIDETVDL